jgi:hypothetical protein
LRALIQRRGFLLTAVALWVAAVSSGTLVLWRYSMTPGDPGSPPQHWPQASSIPLSGTGHTLVMLVHPHCSCSRASLAELAKVMTRTDFDARAWVLFLKPAGFGEDWEKTDLWRRAEEIPRVTVVLDEGGREAELFGARTSGQVLLFESTGQLVFAGGITPGRSHEGDNIGESRLISLATEGRADANHASVYGCGLMDPEHTPPGAG